jgi:ParB family transcriptional regulator, chromosome partitioning protein
VTKRKALGRGLSALFPESSMLDDERGFFYCPVESITPNPLQPRQDFSDLELSELANSIKEKGIIQPVLVTKVKDGFQLIAGERRWRAAQKAGVQKIPAWVRDVSPAESLELALIENIQRKDLNAIEEAMAYQEMIQKSSLTQESLSKRIGKDRSTIANLLRLLKLPDFIQKDVVDGDLTTGHARVLAGINSQASQRLLRDIIIKKSLSVRQTESLAKKMSQPSRKEKPNPEKDYYVESLSRDIEKFLGTKVSIKMAGKKGKIVIDFYSHDELERLIAILT